MQSVKKAGVAVAALLTFGAASCIGPNNAYNSVLHWNSELSESKYVNELAYLGLHIVPAYPLALLGDMLIFNSIEFWSGNNPVSKPEPFKAQEGSGM